jgi:hypothetical protein
VSIGPDRPFLMTHAPYVTPQGETIRRPQATDQGQTSRGRPPTNNSSAFKISLKPRVSGPGELSLACFRLSPLHKVNFTFGTLRQHSRSSRENRSSEVS